MTLDEELDRIFTVRDRNNIQPTIDALLPILAEHPADARVLYEVGGAYDTAGKEQTARSFYEQALQVGLSGDLLRRCYVQYGSTLRNLGEFARSVEVFERARQDFPDSPSLAVFQAISFHASSRFDEAVASLLEVVVEGVESPDIEPYKPSIRGTACRCHSTRVPTSHPLDGTEIRRRRADSAVRSVGLAAQEIRGAPMPVILVTGGRRLSWAVRTGTLYRARRNWESADILTP
ncbi:tetratricopeptide repeat protein [Cryobacterium gelidum]|uniref:Tetratricopeptide repeat protein n=1 Tax=Cryobacterium gelidum TaxID=1259164 RepID=A0A4R9AW83_9MICO|nr:tetratricopeptide repeat protein [Cryobacterium gelidum]TFD70908.1 tetratricopeptide repeat protein [Cryobacterium gelidum]